MPRSMLKHRGHRQPISQGSSYLKESWVLMLALKRRLSCCQKDTEEAGLKLKVILLVLDGRIPPTVG